MVPAVVVVLLLGACGGSGEARTTAATVPTAASAPTTTTSPLPYSLADAQRIVDELDARLAPALERFGRDRMPSLELYAELAAVYSDKGLERMHAAFGRAAAGVWDIAELPLRPPTTKVEEILYATDTCLLVRGPRDWRGTFPHIDLHDGALELKRTDTWRYNDEVWTDDMRPMAEQTQLCQ